MTATGRKKLDELYHPVVDRSEFYTMSDLGKPPVLFSPAEDIDKVRITTNIMLDCSVKTYFYLQLTSMELQNFYGHDPDSLSGDVKASPFLLHNAKATPALKFHNHFPPDVST